jgi:hypothetical protein
MVQGFSGASGVERLEPLAEDCAAAGLLEAVARY